MVPYDDLVKVFQPDVPEFADIPMIEVRQDGWEILRGSLPAEFTRNALRVGPGVFGVFINDLGLIKAVRPQEKFEDPRMIANVFNLDDLMGTGSIDKLVETFEEFIALLRRAQSLGWQLREVLGEGVYLEKP